MESANTNAVIGEVENVALTFAGYKEYL